MTQATTSRDSANPAAIKAVIDKVTAGVENDIRTSLVEHKGYVRDAEHARELALFLSGQLRTSLTGQLKDALHDLKRQGRLEAVLEEIHANLSAVASDDEYLTSQEAAALLKVSRSTMNSLLDAGKLGDLLKTEGGHRRVAKEAVLAYKERRKASRLKALETVMSLSEEMGLDGDTDSGPSGRPASSSDRSY